MVKTVTRIFLLSTNFLKIETRVTYAAALFKFAGQFYIIFAIIWFWGPVVYLQE